MNILSTIKAAFVAVIFDDWVIVMKMMVTMVMISNRVTHIRISG